METLKEEISQREVHFSSFVPSLQTFDPSLGGKARPIIAFATLGSGKGQAALLKVKQCM